MILSFFLLSILIMIPLFSMHHRIFWVCVAIEILVFGVGGGWVFLSGKGFLDSTLLATIVGGVGFLVALIAFFVAIFINQKHLYSDLSSHE